MPAPSCSRCLLVVLEIRHYVTGGDIYQPVSDLTEAAIDVNAGLALTIGLERVRGRTGSIVHNVGALLIAALTLLAIVFELVAVASADFANAQVTGAFFNTILLGYGLPAVLAITLALIARTTRPLPYRVVAAITAVTLALFYLTLEVRRLFHGPMLGGPTSDAEQYSYSTIWLVFGIALLAVGFFLRSQPARFLALGVVALTIAKVFIIDTASIERHLSGALGDRARRGAARHRLALSAPALPARAGHGGARPARLGRAISGPGNRAWPRRGGHCEFPRRTGVTLVPDVPI